MKVRLTILTNDANFEHDCFDHCSLMATKIQTPRYTTLGKISGAKVPLHPQTAKVCLRSLSERLTQLGRMLPRTQIHKLVSLFSILLLGPTKFVNKNVVHPVRLALEFVP